MDFLEKIDKKRYEFDHIEKKILDFVGEYNDIDSLIKTPGYSILNYKNLKWDILFWPKESNTLTVVLDGSRPVGNSPTFNRWSWYNIMRGSYLNIDDPMVKLYDSLELGWYYGTENIDYCDYVVEIVQKISQRLGVENIIFYASSGGGNAATRCASKIDGAFAVVINSQLHTERFFKAKQFQEITSMKLSEDCYSRSNTLCNINPKSKYIFIENILSDDELPQIDYISEYFDISKAEDGLNALAPNVILWLYDAVGINKNAHVSQEWKAMYLAIDRLQQAFAVCDSDSLVQNYGEEYKIYTWLWRGRFLEQVDLAKEKRKCIKFPHFVEYNSSMNRVFDIEKLEIKKSSNQYNHYKIPVKQLKGSSYYKIKMNGVTKGSYIVIKDEKFNRVLIQERVEDDKVTFLFMTSEHADKMEIRIYPCNPGECSDCSAFIDYLCVYESK